MQLKDAYSCTREEISLKCQLVYTLIDLKTSPNTKHYHCIDMSPKIF